MLSLYAAYAATPAVRWTRALTVFECIAEYTFRPLVVDGNGNGVLFPTPTISKYAQGVNADEMKPRAVSTEAYPHTNFPKS